VGAAPRINRLCDANCVSLEITLDAQQLTKLNEASAFELGFPHDFYTKPMVRQITCGGFYDKIVRH